MNLVEVEGFLCRDGTVDANAAYALREDEYRIRGEALTGWAIDVGAQIGTVGLTLAREHPDLRVVCVEAVPESSAVLEQNIVQMGLAERVTSVRAWAGGPNDLTGTCYYGYRGGDVETDGYVAAHRFVGNTWLDSRAPEFAIELPAVSLDSLIERFAMERVALVKIDCEGCEWAFLDTPAVARVDRIVGEYHGGYPGKPRHQADPIARLHELLDATHEIELWSAEPIVGMFEAVHR